MSSLIFQTQTDLVIVAADTLVVSLEDRSPRSFSSKVQIIPHLRMIAAGTGNANFCNEWYSMVMNDMLVDDVEHLNYHTPYALVELYKSNKERYSFKNELTTTIYHFGFSKNDGLIHSYAYRSKNNFISEPIQYGLRYKPECKIDEKIQLPFDIKKIMELQRATQSTQSKENRIEIGGEIQVYFLTNDGYTVKTIDKFSDFEKVKKEIYDKFKNQ
jgi:hypothetical protein